VKEPAVTATYLSPHDFRISRLVAKYTYTHIIGDGNRVRALEDYKSKKRMLSGIGIKEVGVYRRRSMEGLLINRAP
jgi:hypothetical protein